MRGAPHAQSGAALAIALLLLLVLTILAFTGMNTATTELAMSGNEQYRRSAAQASAAGIEQAIARLGAVPSVPGAAPTLAPETALPGSGDERVRSATRYAGEERGLPQSSADKFLGLHFEIESTGISARGASDTQRQGVMVVAATGAAGDASFGRQGTGLE